MEPDTSYDVTSGWMYPQNDITSCGTSAPYYCASNQVYLNGWLAVSEYPNFFGVSLNPNTGLAGSDVILPGYWQFNALFGVWKDCNADGYVGLVDQGLFEYRSEILANWPGVGNRICPVTATPQMPATGLPPFGWFPAHNDGQWVHEFLAFGHPGQTTSGASLDPWTVNSGGGTQVWADWGLPGPLPEDRVHCQLTQPYGTFRTTGGTLNYADCLDGYHVTDAFDAIVESSPQTAPFSFGDKPHGQGWQSSSQANLWNPWGNESDASFVTAWDCRPTSPALAHVAVPGQPTLNQGARNYANVSAPLVPPTANVAGTPAGTVDSIGSGFDECQRTTKRDDFAGGAGGLAWIVAGTTLFGGPDPHYGRDLASAPYGWEGGNEVAYRVGTTELMPANDWVPGGWLAPTQHGYSGRPVVPLSGVTGKGTPGDLGVHAVDNAQIWQGGLFVGEPFADYQRLQVSGVTTTTTYGHVDPGAISLYHLSLPKSAYPTTVVHGTYGIEACGGFTSGVHNGWDCAGAHWPSPEKPGWPYELRDVDCYDQSTSALRGQGVSYGVLTGTACPTPP